MPSIGGITVFSILDPLDLGYPHLINITRAGIVGREYHNTGARGDPKPVRMQIKATDAENIAVIVNTFQSMQATAVAVVDDHGNTYSAQLIHQAQQTGEIRTKSPSDGTTYAIVELTIVFEDVSF